MMQDGVAFQQAWDASYIRAFADRLSAIGLFELGFRPAGTDAGHRAAEMIAQEMRRIGLSDVRKEPFPVYAWGFRGARIELPDQLQSIRASSFPPTPGTPPTGLTAPLVDVGLGREEDYIGCDVRGKLAFVRLDIDVMRWPGVLATEAERHGAAGVVFYYLNGYALHPSGEALNTHDGMCRDAIPVVQVALRDGRYLSDWLSRTAGLHVTLFSQVDADPNGTGHNVIGAIPGRRFPDRFIFVGAHYDAWFHGYWDNASGVAGMLAIARALVESGYQPDHTLIFVASDAEEFGAADTIFDWLIGLQALLEAHPEWSEAAACCFNFDTLCLPETAALKFDASAEMTGFLRQVTVAADWRLRTFAQHQVQVQEYVTPWTETYSWTYFGVPVVQPAFDQGTVSETHYHTQFDTAEMLDFAKSDEAACLVGRLLIQLDRRLVLPYDLSARAASVRASVDWDRARAVGLGESLDRALARLEARAGSVAATVAQVNQLGWPSLSPHVAEIEAVNDRLRSAVSHLLTHCSYLGGDFSHTVVYRHQHSQQILAALERATASLEANDVDRALAILTDENTGLPGAYLARHASYPTYYHYTVGAVNPARPRLFWGEGRALPYIDCWMVLHDLMDKRRRGDGDLAAERYVLEEQRKTVIGWLTRDLSDLIEVLDAATDSLPVAALQALVAKAGCPSRE